MNNYMSNIIDYLKWRGDLSLSQDKINDLDSLVLSRFSYFPFKKIKMNKIETVKSISDKMEKLQEEQFSWNGDKEMIMLMGNSERFGKLLVTDFINSDDEKTQRQFSAITIHLNGELFVSFCGTNATLYGWKEDFNMSFQKNIPSQMYATEYLRQIAQKYPYMIRTGGHSKGGNIAAYACIFNPKSIQDRIIQVINFDGPGFDKSVVESNGYKNIKDKIITFVPQGSIIGRVLEHEEEIEIVKSDEKGLYQHDIYSWEVMGKCLNNVETNTNSSDIINATVRNWLKETTPEQRQIFVDSIYNVLEASEAKSTKELSKNIMKNINKVSKAFKLLPQEDKDTINKMINEAVKSFKLIITETAKEKIEEKKIAKLKK